MVGTGRGERGEEEREKTREGEVRKIIEDMRRRRNDVEMCGLASSHVPPYIIPTFSSSGSCETCKRRKREERRAASAKREPLT